MKYPVIATRGIIVFPQHEQLLEVGRKMSLDAINLAIVQHNSQIVIVSQKDVMKDSVESEKDLFSIGTLATVKIERQAHGGSKTIFVRGIERVSLSDFDFNDGKLIQAQVKPLVAITSNEQEEHALVNLISKQLDRVVTNLNNIPKNVLSSLASGISANDLIDIIANYASFTLIKKQQLLEMIVTNDRLKTLLGFLEDEEKSSKIERIIDSSVRKTLDDQQKEFLLREKMKAIKEELGDIGSKDSDTDKWKVQLEDRKFPAHAKEALNEEIRKFESTPQMAADSNVLRSYIELALSLPWNTYSKDNVSLIKAKNILDKHHFGLKKVKERILEHLAVKINAPDSQSPIITLLGPPGVGKTSLVKSIAEAVGREFIKVSLGGVRDEAEIRGHRRTYVGAMPGKIIQALKKAKTSNPVILLDEIDKMSADYKGDPTSAMLEVLDPEQNKGFQDHYLEIEYDLSQVMFVATANFYENIPGPLLDRVELISIEQYTSEEKLAIAKSYIIPRVLKDNGLNNVMFEITDEAIQFVIDKYTLEAGVRGLQRELSKLARKIIVKKLSTKKPLDKFELGIKQVKELLGKEQVFKETLKGKAEVGLVNGMYYSSVGGGILPIEVTTYESKSGGTILTGSIKDVMKESLNIAVAYVRSNANKFGINFNFDETTIQVHVPAGATPKDGPSAGIAFTTAVISALLNKPIPKEVSLTGEITLRGKVLPIGGLKEKSLGAVEAGVRTIFIPSENKKDLDELAKKVKDDAKIIPVEDYTEVFGYLFKKS